jgi:hypothetical protein
VAGWTNERVWQAVDAWRWIPPGSKRVLGDGFELAVTPGSYSLTYVYGFHSPNAQDVERRLGEIQDRIRALGGTGTRFQVTPSSQPPDLVDRLVRRGYKVIEEADVLIWILRDERGQLHLPEFAAPPGITVREVLTDEEYERFVELGAPIFGDPVPSAESRRGFVAEFRRSVRETGHSDRYLAWEGASAIGRAGMELAGPVARLWGTGVLTEHRHRGAYGALVRARCESGAERGAELALVTARVGTSGPILLRHGFQPRGTVRVLEARW